jgi:hypothetical protein
VTLPVRVHEELSQGIGKALRLAAPRQARWSVLSAVTTAAAEVFERHWDGHLAETAELDAVIDRLHTDLDAARAELAAMRTAGHIASALPDCPRCGAAHWPDCDAGGLHTDTP